MKALVTGGAGFIGSNLVDRLVGDGFEVLVLDDLSTGSRGNLASAIESGVELVECDIAVAGAVHSAVEGFKPDVIHHLAARASVGHSVENPGEDARVNVLGTLAVLEAARSAQTGRVVYVSTGGAVYGEPDVYPTPETSPIGPESPYGVSKYSAETYVGLYSKLHGMSTVTLRLANIYGPRQDALGEGGVVAIFSRAMIEQTVAKINGDGLQSRDFVAVGDVVEACLSAAASQLTGSFNVATGRETTVLDLVAALDAAASPSRLKVTHGPAREGEVRRSLLDPSLIASELGWSAGTTLEDGLRLTLEWQQTQL